LQNWSDYVKVEEEARKKRCNMRCYGDFTQMMPVSLATRNLEYAVMESWLSCCQIEVLCSFTLQLHSR